VEKQTTVRREAIRPSSQSYDICPRRRSAASDVRQHYDDGQRPRSRFERVLPFPPPAPMMPRQQTFFGHQDDLSECVKGCVTICTSKLTNLLSPNILILECFAFWRARGGHALTASITSPLLSIGLSRLRASTFPCLSVRPLSDDNDKPCVKFNAAVLFPRLWRNTSSRRVVCGEGRGEERERRGIVSSPPDNSTILQKRGHQTGVTQVKDQIAEIT